MQEPTMQEPTMQESTMQEPTMQEPTMQEPTMQEPTRKSTPASDAFTVMRSRAYLRLLVTAVVLGVPIAAAAFWFLELIHATQVWIFSDLPGALGYEPAPSWWPLLPLGAGGVLVGFTVRYLPGSGGHSPSDGISTGGRPPTPGELAGIVTAAFGSLAFGAVLGPEAPLIAIGGGLAYAAVKLANRNLPHQAGAMVAATGSFAAISTLFGSPLVGAFLLMEASGLGGATATMVFLPGLMAAGVGSLIFLGLGNLTGYGVFSLAISDPPQFSQIRAVEFLWAVAIGLVAAPVGWALLRLAQVVGQHAHRRPVLVTPFLGLAIATLAITYAAATGRQADEVLFSGQSAIPTLVSHGAEYGVGTLLLLFLGKGLAYVCALGGFRGGPGFPAMFIGAAGGVLLSHLPGLPLPAAVAMGIGAMTAGVLKLPLTAVLLTTLLFGPEGASAMPLVITASAVSYVFTVWLLPAPPAPCPTPAPTRTGPGVPRPQTREPQVERPAPRP